MKSPVEQTKEWLAQIVIGLNLCPFAAQPFHLGSIRYVVQERDQLPEYRKNLLAECARLLEKDHTTHATSLILYKDDWLDFNDYLDFVADSEALIEEAGLNGIIQLATFHPDYQFAETQPDDLENYTNRSPYPMLHLLLEESMELVLDKYPNPESIPQQNIETMKALGRGKINELWAQWQS